MLAYTIRPLLQLLFTLFVLTVLVFTVVQLLPSDIIDVMIGEDPEARAALTKEFGLDQPVNIQCAKWAGRLMQGDRGTSLITRRDISLELFDRIAATAYLAITAIFSR